MHQRALRKHNLSLSPHAVLVICGLTLFVMAIEQRLEEQEPYSVSRVVIEQAGGGKAIRENLESLIPPELTLAVTTLLRNQAPYLVEWVEFHTRMGFDLFIIFDDNSTDESVATLQPYIASGRVVVVHARDSFYGCSHRDPARNKHLQAPCQRVVFNYARHQLLRKTVWMGNFDVDEFIWTPRGSISVIPSLLNYRYGGYDRVRIVGSVFGGNNISEPVRTPVISTYTRRARADPPFEDGLRFGHKELYRPDRVGGTDVHSSWCWTCATITIPPLAPDLRMNHYQYKSRTEQRDKAVQNGNERLEVDPAVEAVVNEVEDTDIMASLVERNPAIRFV